MNIHHSLLTALLACTLTKASQNPINEQQGSNPNVQNQPEQVPPAPAPLAVPVVHHQALQAVQAAQPARPQVFYPQAIQFQQFFPQYFQITTSHQLAYALQAMQLAEVQRQFQLRKARNEYIAEMLSRELTHTLNQEQASQVDASLEQQELWRFHASRLNAEVVRLMNISPHHFETAEKEIERLSVIHLGQSPAYMQFFARAIACGMDTESAEIYAATFALFFYARNSTQFNLSQAQVQTRNTQTQTRPNDQEEKKDPKDAEKLIEQTRGGEDAVKKLCYDSEGGEEDSEKEEIDAATILMTLPFDLTSAPFLEAQASKVSKGHRKGKKKSIGLEKKSVKSSTKRSRESSGTQPGKKSRK